MTTPKLNFNVQNLLNSIVMIACLGVSALLGFFVAWPQYQNYQNAQPVLYITQTKNEQLNAFVTYLQGLSDFQDKLFANMGLSKQAIPETEEAPFFLDQIIQIAELAHVEINALTFGGLSSSSSSANGPQPSTYDSFSRFQPEDGETIDNSESTAQADALLNVDPQAMAQALPTLVPPSEFAVTLEAIGDYSAVQAMLSNLEDARRLIEIQNITLSKVEENTTGGVNETATSYITSQAAKGYLPSADLYIMEIVITGFFMKDPEVAVVGPDVLNSQRNLEEVIKNIEDLTYYEPQSAEEIELNVGRLNPFDPEAEAGTEANVEAESEGLQTLEPGDTP